MKAITVEPLRPETARLEDVPDPEASGSAASSSRRSPPASAAPTARSRPVPVRPGRRRIAGSVSCSGTSRWVRVLDPGGSERACSRATSSSASCAAPIPCRARAAPSVSGTCAATVSTPSGASRRSTATCRSAGASSPSSRCRFSRPSSGSSACCSSRRPWVAKAWEVVGSIGRLRPPLWEPWTALHHRRRPDRAARRAPRRATWARRARARPSRGSGPKPELVRALGAPYHAGSLDRRRASSPT